MPRADDIQRRSIWRRAMDAVFGFDFFISYSWHDGGTYAAALMRRLELQGFEVFLDRDDYASGDDWKQVGAWTLRRTGQLILVGSSGVLTSAPVAREVDIFASTGRRILPIDFGGSLDRLPADSPLQRHLQDEILRIREVPAALVDGPSDDAVATIRRTFTLVRQDKKRLMLLAGVACVMTLLAVASMFLAGYAQVQKTAAFENARKTFVRQADLSGSIAFRLFDEGRPLLGFKVAREGAPKAIEYATPLTARLALALSRGWSQIQEEAELRHPDGNIANAVWQPDGSRAVTATLTDAPRAWSAANGELQATLGNGIRPDYNLTRDPSDLSFSADGQLLATQLGDIASVWETTSWTEVLNTRCEPAEGRYLRLSPDGKTLAAQCRDGVHVWDVASKRDLYHRAEAVESDGTMPWLATFDFTDGGDTLVLVDDKSATVGVLRHIASGTPELISLKRVSADIQRSAPDQGFVSVHPTRVAAEVVLRGQNAIFRIDLEQDSIMWRTTYASDEKHWFQMLRSVDAIATAGLTEDGDVEYVIARGPRGPLLYEGRLHFTGKHVAARTNAVSFQDNGKGIGVALNTGVLVVALGRDDGVPAGDTLFDFPPGSGLQMLKGDGQAVHSSPCAGRAAEASRITLLADGSRMIATCGDGGVHMVRLQKPPIARLPGVRPVARFGDALVRLGGTGADTRFETVNVAGEVTGQSEPIGEEVMYWLANEAGSNALLVGASGAVRTWRAGTPGFVTYDDGVHLADIRAARFAPDGSRAALLDKNGVFVRLRIGEASPEFVGRVGGPALPAIDFAIDPALSAVAFTTADLDLSDSTAKPPPSVDEALAVVATPGKETAQFSCRHSQSSRYAAALFSEAAGAPTIYLVGRDRSLEKLALKAGAFDVTGLPPCPVGLSDAFRPDLKWAINTFTHESIRIVEATSAGGPSRLIFGGARDYPLELVDLASQRSITDLSPTSGGNYPLSLSADGRYLATLGDTAKTIEIFDVTTGSLLRRIRTEQAVAIERGALLFAPGDQVLLVRLASGATVTYAITLLEGTDLLEQVRSIGVAPLTDDETREIYDIRQRFSRQPAYGALLLVSRRRA
jgi:WD40 repeat protein